jgi:tetratricopeptide (TPR) repeat protein
MEAKQVADRTRAVDLLKRALRHADREPVTDRFFAAVWNELGFLQHELAQPYQAEKSFRRSLAYCERADHAKYWAAVLANLAALYYEYRYNTKLVKLRPALEQVLELPGISPAQATRVQLALAEVAYIEKRHNDLESLSRQLAGRLEGLAGTDPTTLSCLWNDLGLLAMARERLAEAIYALRRAEALTPNDAESAHARTRMLLNLSVAYEESGQLSEADALCGRALEIAEASLGPDSRMVVAALWQRAKVWRKLGREREAKRLEARARNILAELGRQNPLKHTVDVGAFTSAGR